MGLAVPAPTTHRRTLAEPVPGFDTRAFLDHVTEGLGEALMGYAFVVRDADGKRVIEAEYGLARTASEEDGEQPFTIRTKSAWGSVSKMVTFTAAMQRIQAVQGKPLGMTTNPPVQKPSLGASMRSFLPLRWRETLHEEFAAVTIAMLMQHRAGFAKTAPPPIWERLENGPETKKGVGFRKYSNTSASMFQNMPTFFDPHTAHFVEETLKAVKESVYDPEISKQAKLIYQAYVQENIWKPLGIKALCNDTNFARKNYAMYYKSPEDEKGKLVQPDPENPKCAPGGWILAALAMSKFAHALTATDAIISPENYALMANTADTSQRLGWASVHPFADGTGFSHNGSRWNGKAKGQMTVFPNGLTAVGVANSKPPQGVSFRKLFNQAYEAALS